MHIGSLVLAASITAGLTALTVSTLDLERWWTTEKIKQIQEPVFEAMEQNMFHTLTHGGCVRVPVDTSVHFLMTNQWLPDDFESRSSWDISTAYFTLGSGDIAKLSVTLAAHSDEEAQKLNDAARHLSGSWRMEGRKLTLSRTTSFVRSEFDEANFNYHTGCFELPREG